MFELFDDDCKVLMDNLKKNRYPEQLLNSVLTNFVSKMENHQPEEKPATVERKEVMVILPFHGSSLSNQIQKSLTSLLSNAYPQITVN